MSTFQFDVFISHNSVDKPVVRDIADKLKSDGFLVWFDEWVILPGMSIPNEIEKGLQESRALVLCMSDAAFASDWVTLERQTALFRDPINRERNLVLLLLSDAEIPDMLKQFVYIDYRTPSTAAYQKLFASIQ